MKKIIALAGLCVVAYTTTRNTRVQQWWFQLGEAFGAPVPGWRDGEWVPQMPPQTEDGYVLEHNDRQKLNAIHPADRCAGESCTIHNRSDHHMRSWKQWWRNDIKLMERICPHGVGHPDPDDPNAEDSIHGCDGCCRVVETSNAWPAPETSEVVVNANQPHSTRWGSSDGMDGFTPDMLRVHKPVFEVYWTQHDRDEENPVWTIDSPGRCEVGDTVLLQDDEDPEVTWYGRCISIDEPNQPATSYIGGPYMRYTFEVL